jgi:hypothetical protein
MPLFRALAKNMAASYFGKKAPYGFVMEVTLLYVFILWLCRVVEDVELSLTVFKISTQQLLKQQCLKGV